LAGCVATLSFCDRKAKLSESVKETFCQTTSKNRSALLSRSVCESIVEQAARLFVFARDSAGESPTLRKFHRLGTTGRLEITSRRNA
jgi:hypothetical protein